MLDYGDAAGSLEYQMAIGQRRADAVRTALLAEGIAPARITAQARGKLPAALPGAADFRRLVELAVELKVWEQRATWPEGTLYDFAFARLTLKIGETECTIREPFNDLVRRDRILRLRTLMEQIALLP